MNFKMRKILNNMQKYNSTDMAFQNFGLNSSILYDALVIAPGWKPTKLLDEKLFKVTVLTVHSYISGYLVEREGLRIAWVQIASSASNLIDHLAICAELKFKKLIFIGAAGALKEDINVGELYTPSYCVSGVFANTYLKQKLSDFVPFEKVFPNMNFVDKVITLSKDCGITLKKASVFCTDSIALEYSHLDEIKRFDTDLIEMETSSFYLMAELLEIPAIALLVVSDNSAVKNPLIGRSHELNMQYDNGRKNLIPELIFQILKKL